jgi:hypothetical protein
MRQSLERVLPTRSPVASDTSTNETEPSVKKKASGSNRRLIANQPGSPDTVVGEALAVGDGTSGAPDDVVPCLLPVQADASTRIVNVAARILMLMRWLARQYRFPRETHASGEQLVTSAPDQRLWYRESGCAPIWEFAGFTTRAFAQSPVP